MTDILSVTAAQPTSRRATIAGYLPEQAAITTGLLESLGFAVSTANNGREVLHQCRQDPPDIVLLDLHIGDGAGLKWISELRVRSSTLPKIIFTAPSYALDAIWQALGLGVDEYILRPFTRAALIEKLASVGISTSQLGGWPK